MITRRSKGVTEVVSAEGLGNMTPRQPVPRSTARAIQQAAENINEVDAVLDDWFKKDLVPAILAADFYEMRYHLQKAQCWLQGQGAQVEPEEL